MKLAARVRTTEKSLRFPLTVGSAAAVLGVAPSTLRVYDKLGIVSPDRDSEGRRLYLPDDVKWIREYRASIGKA